MLFRLIYILSLFLLLTPVNAQNFFRSYGNTDDETAKAVVETKDTAFFLLGSSSSFVDGTSNFYLLRIDSSGTFNWSKTYGGSGIEQGHDIALKPNGHYLLTGHSNSFGNGGYDILNIEIDSLGNEIWLKTYGGSDWDFAYGNTTLPTGESIITGSTYSIGNGNQDGFLMMIDNNGDSLWMKSYGDAEENVLRKTMVTATGELVSIGYTVRSAGDKDYYILKTQADGDTIWTKKIGTPVDDEGYAVCEIGNGNYLFAGYSEGIGLGAKEAYYFVTDTSGVMVWTQFIGGTADDIFTDVCYKPGTNRFFSSATTQSYGNGGDEAKGYLLRTDGGYYIGSNNYGTLMNEELHGIIYTSHRRTLMVGNTNSPYGNTNVLAIMSDTLFPTQSVMTNYIDVTAVGEIEPGTLKLYPNPANQFISFSEKCEHVCIFNQLGQIVLNTGEIQDRLSIAHLPAGIYFVQIHKDGDIWAHLKLIISR